MGLKYTYHTSHLFRYSFHVWNHNWVSLLWFVQVRVLDGSDLYKSIWPHLIQCWVWVIHFHPIHYWLIWWGTSTPSTNQLG